MLQSVISCGHIGRPRADRSACSACWSCTERLSARTWRDRMKLVVRLLCPPQPGRLCCPKDTPKPGPQVNGFCMQRVCRTDVVFTGAVLSCGRRWFGARALPAVHRMLEGRSLGLGSTSEGGSSGHLFHKLKKPTRSRGTIPSLARQLLVYPARSHGYLGALTSCVEQVALGAGAVDQYR